MLSKQEQDFFASFSDFEVNHAASPVIEFCRLADLKHWEQNSGTFRAFWRVCFETDCSLPLPIDVKEPKLDAGSPAQPIEEPVYLLERNLQQLIIDPNDNTASCQLEGLTLTPTASVDGDGVQIRYFDIFPGFDNNNSAPIRHEFNRLAAHQNWQQQTQIYDDQFLRCCTDEFKFFCGYVNTKLESWQSLVLNLGGTSPPPATLNQCKKALKGYHVCIFDFIDCKRAGTEIKPIFTTVSSFRKYVKKSGNRFPRAAAKCNPFLSVLLEKVFGA